MLIALIFHEEYPQIFLFVSPENQNQLQNHFIAFIVIKYHSNDLFAEFTVVIVVSADLFDF